MSTNIGSPSGLRYVSVCAGIEAATAAWHSLGWTPVLFSEIEPFPRAVLQHHYPDVPLIGDFTQMLPTADGPAIIPPPEADLLVGGTPCQAFSVAGKRLSLEDYRGNLTLAFADLYHAGNYRYALWENVPGVLSTRDNAFGCLLGRLVGADGALPGHRDGRWSRAGVVSGPLGVAAWRVCDAQFFGVAQRRQRVFVLVGRGAGNWTAPAALLPVGVGLSGDPAPRREARQDAPGDAGVGARGRGAVGVTAPTLPSRSRSGGGMGTDFDCDGGIVAPGDQSIPLGNAEGSTGLPFLTAANIGKHLNNQTPLVASVTGDVTHALKAEGSDGSEDGTGRGVPIVAFDTTQITSKENRNNPQPGDPCHPLAAGAHPPAVFALQTDATPKVSPDVSFTLKQPSATGGGQPAAVFAPEPQAVVAIQERAICENPDAGPDGVGVKQDGTAYTLEARPVPQAVAHTSLRPRRLTPVECERLQGFPDNYTLVPFGRPSKAKLDADFLKYQLRGNPKNLTAEECARLASDGPRYKALGNSMAVPVMHWIGERIDLVERVWHLDTPVDLMALGLGDPEQLSLLSGLLG